ncbi:WD repeat-containing protein 87-like [Helianthus annuus]|uniref:WD repeat-containing protein 87-like n=1 Tax=Helianthus annuus TaxID=4232 RepID=UPI000B8FF6E7|nr:WD repeat-containing protein 87-like [Helianthus annuus]
MKIEDYNWWKNRFEGWIKAFAPESWLKLKYGYTEPVKEGGELVNEKEFTEIDVKNIVAENKMITLLKQSEDYYKKAIYHQKKFEPPRLKQPEEKSRALAVIHDDEGYDWSQDLPEEDAVGYAFVANVDHDRWWRRDYARWEIEKFRESFKEATFNTRRLSDKEYLPDLLNKIKEICEASLPKVVEMKKRKEEELKKMVEEVKVLVKNDAEGEQKIEEKQKEEEEEEKKKKEEDQTEKPVLKETE